MMKKAFYYMFSDNKFYKKALTFFVYVTLLMYCSFFSITGCNGTISLNFIHYIIIALTLLFGYSICEGYKIAIIKSINNVNENLHPLPILNLKKDFVIGIKYLISILIFSVPFFCIMGAFLFASGFAIGVYMPRTLINISGILFVLSVFAYCVYLSCFLPASLSIYANTNSIWSFYKYEEVFNLVVSNKMEYAKSALMYFILSMVVKACYRIYLFTNNKPLYFLFIALLVLSCIITYLYFVMSYVVAKIDKNITKQQ